MITSFAMLLLLPTTVAFMAPVTRIAQRTTSLVMADKYDSDFSYNLGKYDRLAMGRAYDLPAWQDFEGTLCQEVHAPTPSTKGGLDAMLTDVISSFKSAASMLLSSDMASSLGGADDGNEYEECLLDADNQMQRSACMGM